MAGHDEFFKTLLEGFPGEFLDLVAPRLAVGLDVEKRTAIGRELFTDYPDPVRRQVDLAWRVPSRSGEPEVVVVHVEIEGQSRRAMEQRMLEYAVLLRAKEAAPVLPIVLYLRGGPAKVEKRTATEEIFGETVLRVDYFVFGLSRSRAEEYLARPNPLGWGLAALMSTDMEPAEHRFRCMQAIATADLTEHQRRLLGNCVGTYLQLTGDHRRRYEEMITKEKATEIEAMEGTWFGKIAREAREKAEKQGERKGKKEGQLRGERRMLERMLEVRFGPLSEDERRRIEALDSTEKIERIFDQALEAGSLDELDLGG